MKRERQGAGQRGWEVARQKDRKLAKEGTEEVDRESSDGLGNPGEATKL